MHLKHVEFYDSGGSSNKGARSGSARSRSKSPLSTMASTIWGGGCMGLALAASSSRLGIESNSSKISNTSFADASSRRGDDGGGVSSIVLDSDSESFCVAWLFPILCPLPGHIKQQQIRREHKSTTAKTLTVDTTTQASTYQHWFNHINLPNIGLKYLMICFYTWQLHDPKGWNVSCILSNGSLARRWISCVKNIQPGEWSGSDSTFNVGHIETMVVFNEIRALGLTALSTCPFTWMSEMQLSEIAYPCIKVTIVELFECSQQTSTDTNWQDLTFTCLSIMVEN